MKAAVRSRSDQDTVERINVDTFLETAAYSGTAPGALHTVSSLIQTDAIVKGWQASNAKEAFVKDEIEQSVKAQMQQLKDALSLFKNQARARYVIDIDLHSAHSLQEVVQALSDFQIQQDQRTGFWARMNHAFEKLSDRSTIYKQWLELLPTQDHYLSVLCGGLKLIIGAMQRMKKVREEISLAFERLPSMLLCSDRTEEIFPDDFEMRACSKKMLGKTFEILRLIVLELHQSAAKTFGKALLRQDLYAEGLKLRLEEMEQLRKNWQDIAATSSYRSIRSMETTLEHLPEQVAGEHRATRAAMQQICDDMKQVFRTLCSDMYKDRVLKGSARPEVDDRFQPSQIEEAPAENSLPSNFEYIPDVDTEIMQNRLWAGPAEAQDRLHILVSNPQFGSWFSDTGSSALVVHENRRLRGLPSAASYLCAKTTESINSQTVSSACVPISMYFCCSSHVHNHDPFCGPTGMLRALIGQLLYQIYENDLADSVTKIMKRIRKIDPQDTAALVDLLTKIVQKLSTRTVLYCILDDIATYEVAEWRDEAAFVVDGLSRFAAPGAVDCIFKLLLTSAERCITLHHGLPEDAVIELPSHVPRVGDFSENAWLAAKEAWAV